MSIVSLIYQSRKLADWVYESAIKFTPMIARGEAELLFVANDPTTSLVEHLQAKGYPFIVNRNVRLSDDELFALGYGTPEYISRVYRGYNEGIRTAVGDYVVLVNSDNYFSPDWLENLLKYSDRSRVISTTLVERIHPTFGTFPGALHGEFGATAETFDEAGFLAFVARAKQTGLRPGGAYMPALFHRDIAIEAGLFPCGNIAGSSFALVAKYGDEAFFDTLRSLGVSHVTALDSICYHLKEGERADPDGAAAVEVASAEMHAEPGHHSAVMVPFPIQPAIVRVSDSMVPTPRHETIIERLMQPEDVAAQRRALAAALTSGGLDRAQRDRARAELARLEAEAMGHQTDVVRRAIERAVGPRLAAPILAVVRRLVRPFRPIRRMLARRSWRRRVP